MGEMMKVTMTKIWVAAALLAIVGIAQVQNNSDSGANVSGQILSSNPYLTTSQK